MTKQTMTGKIDVTQVMRENSREAFKTMPRPKRIGDKRHKPNRYGWRREEE